MGVRDLAYGIYARQLMSSLNRERTPRHVGVILDGNRRWAAVQGSTTAHGHRAGADKITEFLTWCEEVGVEVVTLWLLSTDNLSRAQGELEPLLAIIEQGNEAKGMPAFGAILSPIQRRAALAYVRAAFGPAAER